METFGLIMCFVIFAGLHHLANWLFRLDAKDNRKYADLNEFGFLGSLTVVSSILVAYSIIQYLKC